MQDHRTMSPGLYPAGAPKPLPRPSAAHVSVPPPVAPSASAPRSAASVVAPELKPRRARPKGARGPGPLWAEGYSASAVSAMSRDFKDQIAKLKLPSDATWEDTVRRLLSWPPRKRAAE